MSYSTLLGKKTKKQLKEIDITQQRIIVNWTCRVGDYRVFTDINSNVITTKNAYCKEENKTPLVN